MIAGTRAMKATPQLHSPAKTLAVRLLFGHDASLARRDTSVPANWSWGVLERQGAWAAFTPSRLPAARTFRIHTSTRRNLLAP
jgi:hypothetical protein